MKRDPRKKRPREEEEEEEDESDDDDGPTDPAIVRPEVSENRQPFIIDRGTITTAPVKLFTDEIFCLEIMMMMMLLGE